MNNRSSSSTGGYTEHNDRTVQHAEAETSIIETSEGQMLMDYLLELGFAFDEAEKLIDVREHLYENAEMRQRMQEDYRVQFARWLYEQGEISEIGEP
jgi:hypothetical protein